jgi:DNA-binding protein H-NS
MSKLAAIKKQIAALEAEAERITRQEMSGAIAKVREIMSTFGLTIEHLQTAVAGKGRAAAKPVKSKRAGGGVAKYADPKTGKTWSGFGRAPAWIAGARNRDAFLVDKSGVKAPEAVVKAPGAKKKSATKAASAKKVAKPAAKKAVAVAKKATRKAAAPAAPKKKPSAKKAAPKSAAKKSAKRRAAPGSAAGASAAAEGAALSAT